MTIETEMSLNADGNTAVTACLWQQLADYYPNRLQIWINSTITDETT